MASSYTFCERHLRLKVFGVQTSRDDDGNAAANIGPGAEKLDDERAKTLQSFVEEVGNEKALLAFWELDRLSDLRVRDYDRALQMCEAKRKAKR